MKLMINGPVVLLYGVALVMAMDSSATTGRSRYKRKKRPDHFWKASTLAERTHVSYGAAAAAAAITTTERQRYLSNPYGPYYGGDPYYRKFECVT